MRRLLVSALLFLPVAPVRAQEDPDRFARCLELLAQNEPDGTFFGASSMPPGFAEFLAARGVRPRSGLLFPDAGDRVALRHRKVRELFAEFRPAPDAPAAPRLKAPPPGPRVPGALPRDLSADEHALSRLFSGAGHDDDEELRGVTLMRYDLGRGWARRDGGRGPRFHGVDLAVGEEAEDDPLDPSAVGRGFERLTDWDVKLKVRQESLGFRAKYRHPESIRGLQFDYEKTEDVPGLLGAGGARDRAYAWVGKDRDAGVEKDGWKARMAAAIDEYWGLGLGWSEKSEDSPEGREASRGGSLGVGFSPLGDNAGKLWNLGFSGGVNWTEQEKRSAEESYDRSGFGYSAGVAFTHALRQLPMPWESGNVDPRDKDRWFFLDRARVSLGVADSEISPLTVTAGCDVTCWATRYLKLKVGCEADWCEEEGVDVKFVFGGNLKLRK